MTSICRMWCYYPMSFTRSLIALLSLVFLMQGCSSPKKWGPDIYLLRGLPIPQNEAFEKQVVRFYELFRDKKWSDTYGFRTSKFRSRVSHDVYLKAFDLSDKSWHLYNYNVKSVTVLNEKGVQLIIEFFEAENQVSTYRVVDWIIEDGEWKIENDGSPRSPFGIKLLN